MFKQLALPIPATLNVCDCGLVVSLADRIKVFDTPIMLKELYHISDIREVGVILRMESKLKAMRNLGGKKAKKNFNPMFMQVFCEDKSSLAVRMVDGGQILKFTSSRAEAIAKDISNCISKWQNQQPVRKGPITKLKHSNYIIIIINAHLTPINAHSTPINAARSQYAESLHV